MAATQDPGPSGRRSARSPWPLPRIAGPAPTIRLRLTVLYGLVFLVTGAVLLTIGYALVRHNLGSHPDYRMVLQRLGIPPSTARLFWGRPLALAPGSPAA